MANGLWILRHRAAAGFRGCFKDKRVWKICRQGIKSLLWLSTRKNPGSVYIGTGDQAYHYDPTKQKWSQIKNIGPDSTISSINTEGGLHMTSCWGVPSKAKDAGPTDLEKTSSPQFVWKNTAKNSSGDCFAPIALK